MPPMFRERLRLCLEQEPTNSHQREITVRLVSRLEPVRISVLR